MKKKLKNTFFAAFGILGALLLLSLLLDFWAAGSARSRTVRLSQSLDLRRRGNTHLRGVLDLQLGLSAYLRGGREEDRQSFSAALAAQKSALAESAGIEPKDLQKERLSTASSLLDKWAADYALPQADAKRRMGEARVGSLLDPAKGDKLFKDLRDMLSVYEASAAEDAGEAQAAAMAAFGRLNLLILIGGVLIGGGAAGVLFHLLKTSVRPLEGILAWFDALHSGKPFNMEIPAANEIGDLVDAFTRLGEDLKHSRKEFEELAISPESSPHPILELKSDGSVAYANAAAKSLAEKAGITTAELVPTEASKQLADLAGKDSLTRREKSVGESRYDFVFHSTAGKDLVFAVAFEKQRKS